MIGQVGRWSDVPGTHAAREPVVVLTAGSGVGKTTWCARLAAAARARDLTVAGLITPIEPGAPIRRWAEDLHSGERRLLACEDSNAGLHPDTPHWRLYDDALQWGDACLRDAREADVLVIDELGPVELTRGRGWLAGATEALSGRWRLAVVTVRPLLVNNVLEMLAGSPCQIVRPDGRGALPAPEDLLAQRFGPGQPRHPAASDRGLMAGQ